MCNIARHKRRFRVQSTMYSFFIVMLKTSFERSIVKRWVGSKFDFLETIYSVLPNDIENIVELFCGSAVFSFNLNLWKPKFTQDNLVCINDANPNLINFYNCLKFDPKKLIDILLDYEELHSEGFYAATRESFNKGGEATYLNKDYIKAAEFIYLHYTCFNGLYGVNSKGSFNVPIGRNSQGRILKFKINFDDFIAASHKLQYITPINKDYKDFLDISDFLHLGKKDLLFIDPPYYKTHDKYNSTGFTLKDHIELCQLVKEVDKKGIYFILFNSDNILYHYYLKEFSTIILERKGTVNSKGDNRQKVKEMLYTNISLGG